MSREKELSSLLPGESGRVCSLLCSGGVRRRMLDIGLIKNTEVVCVGESPLGDPRAYMIRGKVIAIRREDAKTVLLELITNQR